LTFDAGSVALDTGCNTGRGSYTVDGDTVTFGPIATTRVACVEADGQQVEQAVLTVLTGAATTAIDGPRAHPDERRRRAPATGRAGRGGGRHDHHDGRRVSRGGIRPASS